MAFVRFTSAEFEASLAAGVRSIVEEWEVNSAGIRIVKETPTRFNEELAYRIYVGRGQVYIKVYSSIEPSTGLSSEIGTDAIRVVLLDEISGVPLMKNTHVKRVPTWSKNMEDRLFKTFDTAYGLEFCECGSPKIERTGKNGKFLGCSNWKNAHAPKLAK